MARDEVTGRRRTGRPHIDIELPPPTGPPIDTLVPDPAVARELGISSMTVWRWDHKPELTPRGWPPALRIHRRKYRSRRALDAFKATLARRAIEARGEGETA